jgi:creatinine amidohydrolase
VATALADVRGQYEGANSYNRLCRSKTVYRDTDVNNVDWGAMSYEERQATGTRDGSVALVPVGSVEQHGSHLPVATDSMLVKAVACAGAQQVSDDLPVVVTPTE